MRNIHLIAKKERMGKTSSRVVLIVLSLALIFNLLLSANGSRTYLVSQEETPTQQASPDNLLGSQSTAASPIVSPTPSELIIAPGETVPPPFRSPVPSQQLTQQQRSSLAVQQTEREGPPIFVPKETKVRVDTIMAEAGATSAFGFYHPIQTDLKVTLTKDTKEAARYGVGWDMGWWDRDVPNLQFWLFAFWRNAYGSIRVIEVAYDEWIVGCEDWIDNDYNDFVVRVKLVPRKGSDPGIDPWDTIDPPGEDGGDGCEVQDTIDLENGNNFLTFTDLSYASLGPSFSFSRAYSSRWSYNGPLGYGWTHNYNTNLKENEDGSVVESNEIGTQYKYKANADGTYTSSPGRDAELIKNPDGTFLLTEKTQLKKRFGTSGKFLALIDINTNSMTFGYDTKERLINITDASGRQTHLTYSADDKITRIIDPAQRVVEFSYDSDSNLIEFKDVAGLTTTYSYDPEHNLVKLTSFDNKTYTFAYDGQNRLVSRTNYASNTRGYTYDPDTRTSTVTDPKGNKTLYKMDEKGRTISSTDPAGAETKYEWDANNNITKTTDPLGRVQESTFDAKGNMLTSKDQLGSVTTYTYTDKNQVSSVKDALGNTRSFVYDSKGNLLREIDTNSNTVVSYTFDNNGNTTGMTDALGHTYHYSFDRYGNLIEEKDPLGHKISHTYNIIDWRTGTEDAKGRVTSFEYNTRGDLIEEKYPDGTSTKYEYHGCCGILDAVIDANLNKIEYFYDDSRRLVKVRDASEGETSYEYDENANRTAIIDPKGNKVSFSYNERNQLVAINYPDGTSESLSYNLDGSLKFKTDGNGDTTSFNYDAVGRMTSKTYPDSSKVEYTFDAVGNRVTMTDSTGVTAYTYDNLYRPTKITLPSGKNISYTHDIAGNRTGMVDYEGKTYGYKYNELNQLKTFELPNREKVDYKYDTLNAISKISYPNSTYINYTYNNMNRVEKISNFKKKTFKDKLISVFAYSYDPVGNRLKMVERGSFAHSKETSYNYDPLYRLEKVVYPNETTESYNYDQNSNRVKRETVKRYFCSIFAGWKYDEKGAKNFIHYLFHPKYVTYISEYSYDNANKLLETVDKKESDSKTKLVKTTTFDYDRNGNQVKESVLHKGSDKPVESTYEYDYDNRLTEALIKGTKLYQFGYDAEGRRISTTVSNVRKKKGQYCPTPTADVMYHLYDGSNLIMDLDSKGKVVSKYNYGNGLTSIDSKNLNGFYHQDALGSITEITGKHGNVLRDYRYDAWGSQTSGGEGYGDNNPFRYVGSYGVRWQDNTFGHYHMGARYYQPNTGRFTQRDPILELMFYDPDIGARELDLPNRYLYVKNNPVLSIDPTGLSAYATFATFWGARRSVAGEFMSTVFTYTARIKVKATEADVGIEFGVKPKVYTGATWLSRVPPHVWKRWEVKGFCPGLYDVEIKVFTLTDEPIQPNLIFNDTISIF